MNRTAFLTTIAGLIAASAKTEEPPSITEGSGVSSSTTNVLKVPEWNPWKPGWKCAIHGEIPANLAYASAKRPDEPVCIFCVFDFLIQAGCAQHMTRITDE